MIAAAGKYVLFAVVILTGTLAVAAEIRLQGHVGICEYTYSPVKDYRYTKCSAEALLLNEQTSEVYSCRVAVEGDQFVSPSVPETAPDIVTCKKIAQPFDNAGSYGLKMVDDTAKADRTLNRLQGSYTWKNGFWIFSRQSLDVRFCSQRQTGSAPATKATCSKKVDWIKN
jgi:hypothetical protein